MNSSRSHLVLPGSLLVVAFLAVATAVYSGYRIVGSTSHEFIGTVVEQAPLIEGVDLLGPAGRTITFPDAWRGKLVLVFFGYTSCPDICPLTMARLAQTYKVLGEPEDLQVVMITVDPLRDTPERLRHYLEAFHPSFVGLDGDLTTITELASKFYVGASHTEDGLVVHSDHVALLDRRGRLRLVYGGDKVLDMLGDLRYVRARKSW